jgi:hypothetical protein
VHRRPSAPEPIEFRLSWKRRLGGVAAILLLPASWVLPPLMTGPVTVHLPGAVAVSLVVTVLITAVLRNRTMLSEEKITFFRLGRPSLRATSIPWREIAQIDARRRVKYRYPVLRLTDGRELWARLPCSAYDPRLADAIAEMRRRHAEELERDLGAGNGPKAAPSAAAPPATGGVRRRRGVAGLCALIVVVDVMALAAATVRGAAAPPDVLTCPLVPAGLIQQIAPDARTPRYNSHGADLQPGDVCHWRHPADTDATQNTPPVDISLSVYGFGADSGRDSYERDQRQDTAEHVIHTLPGAGEAAYTWAAAGGGSFTAQAHALAGSYRVSVELYTARAASLADAEQQAAAIIQAAATKLQEN